jgi:putative copper export protein
MLTKMSSSSIPCYEAFVLSASAVSFGSLAAVLAMAAFGIYIYRVHRNPSIKSTQTKYDIESAAWLMIITTIGALSVSTSLIMNYYCGEKCPSATLQCNTQMGSSGAALIASIGSVGAAIMKILSMLAQQTQQTLKAGYTGLPDSNGSDHATN